jgi:hypothetical protein
MDPAKIQIDRVSNAWVDRGRAYEVFINGKSRGKVRRGEQIEIEVDPGSQDVHLAVDWCRSPTLTIDAKPGARSRLRCRPANPLMIPYTVTFGRDRYIRLESV